MVRRTSHCSTTLIFLCVAPRNCSTPPNGPSKPSPRKSATRTRSSFRTPSPNGSAGGPRNIGGRNLHGAAGRGKSRRGHSKEALEERGQRLRIGRDGGCK